MIGLLEMFIEHGHLTRDWEPAPREKVAAAPADRWVISRRWYKFIDACSLRIPDSPPQHDGDV